MRTVRGCVAAACVANALLGGCTDEGDGDAGDCTDDSPVIAFDHETLDPDRGIGGGVPEVSVATADGDREMITGDWVVSQARFAPDGERLVVVKADGDYESAGPDATTLWVIGTDGLDATEPRELTRGEVLDEDPDWSPDGATIAFVRIVYDNGEYRWQIMTVPAAGGEPTEVPSVDADRLEEPAWSPDGTRLAFIRGVYVGDDDEETTVWTMAADGSDAVPLVTLTYVEEIEWSPDGTSLLVGTGSGAHMVDVGTGAAELLSDRIHEAVWSPDGERIYYFDVPPTDHSDAAIRRSRVEGDELLDTEDVLTDAYPGFGLDVGPCG